MESIIWEFFVKNCWDSIIFWRYIGISLGVINCTIIFLGWKFRKNLHQRLINWIKKPDFTNHDVVIFKAINEIMTEENLYLFLDHLQSDDSYSSSDSDPIASFIHYYNQKSHYFLLEQLHEQAIELVEALEHLTNFTSTHFFVYPNVQSWDNTRHCMHPTLNVDREGDGSSSQMKKYDSLQKEMNVLCKNAKQKYEIFRITVKKQLIV